MPRNGLLPRVILYLALVLVCTSLTNGAVASSGSVLLLDDGAVIRVPVTMFEKTLYFAVDTGSSITALDTSYSETLGKSIEAAKHDTPHSRDNITKLYACPKFSIGTVRANLDRVACIDLEMIRRVTGEK